MRENDEGGFKKPLLVVIFYIKRNYLIKENIVCLFLNITVMNVIRTLRY